jgi:hypothetical protein
MGSSGDARAAQALTRRGVFRLGGRAAVIAGLLRRAAACDADAAFPLIFLALRLVSAPKLSQTHV